MDMNMFGSLREKKLDNSWIDPFKVESGKNKEIDKIDAKNLVSIRYTISSNNSLRLNVSVGLNICKDIYFNEKEKVNLFIKKDGLSLLMIKASEGKTYALNHSKLGNFLYVSFIYPFKIDKDDFRLGKTIYTDFVCNNNKIIVNLSPLIVDKNFYALHESIR